MEMRWPREVSWSGPPVLAHSRLFHAYLDYLRSLSTTHARLVASGPEGSAGSGPRSAGQGHGRACADPRAGDEARDRRGGAGRG
jgi:hypothetical protein